MSDKGSTKKVGNSGEDIAIMYLQRKGYTILGRNLRNAAGEADIVVSDGDRVIFVEVKARHVRSMDDYIRPAYAVTRTKEKRYFKIAAVYMKDNELSCGCRFDVIEVLWLTGSPKPKVRHIRNAYWPDGYI